MKSIFLKKIIAIAAILLFISNTSRSQVTLFYEDWSSSSFNANGWTFPNGQANWQTGFLYTPFGFNPPNAYFNWSPTQTNYSYSLVSPTINATAYSGIAISLDYLLELDNFSTSTIEQFMVEYKDVSSSTWTVINTYTNNISGITDYSVTNAVLAGMGGQNFQLRFTAFGANSFNINGWGLDSIVVNAASCPTIAPNLLASSSSSISCSGGAVNLFASGANTYTWNPGNLTGSSIVVNPTVNTTYTVTGTLVGCTVVPVPASISISTTPSPSVAITGGSSICQNQTATLTASGGVSYTWSPPSSLSSTNGTVVTASPSVTTLYSLVGVASNGCTDSTTFNVLVNNAPAIVNLSASPAAVCPAGGNSTLNVAAAVTSNYTVTSITYSPIPTPAGATTLCMNGTQSTALTNGSLDDGDWESLNLPFTFNFFGNSYTTFAVGTNGFFHPGSVPNTYFGYGGTFPDPFSTTPCIATMYSDLDFSAQGTIEYFTVGVAPNRKFVVNWSNGQYFFQSGQMDVQMIIYETSNIIEIHTTAATADNSQVEAIQDGTGSVYFDAPGRNGTYYTVTTGDAYRFAPIIGTASYSWTPSTYLNSTSVASPIASNVTAPVIYTVTATIFGCSTTGTLNLNTGTPSTISVVASPGALCANQSASITTNGNFVSYNWSTGDSSQVISVTPSVTTVYTVVATNSVGCTSTQAVTVTVGTAPTISVSAGSGTVCAGAATGLTASGATSYTWNTGANGSAIAVSPSVTTTYSVAGSTGGCNGTASVTITVNSLPSVSLSAAQTTVCVNGSTVALSGSPAGGVYTGSNVSSGVFTPGSTAGTFMPSYGVTNTVTGCSNSASVTIVVSSCTGVNERSISGLSVYPNPTNGSFYIELGNNSLNTFELTDMTGRVIVPVQTFFNTAEVNMSGLSDGVYFVKISNKDGSEVIKVIKQ
jgi:hypothetical protein